MRAVYFNCSTDEDILVVVVYIFNDGVSPISVQSNLFSPVQVVTSETFISKNCISMKSKYTFFLVLNVSQDETSLTDCR